MTGPARSGARLRRARVGVSLVFLINGAVVANWVTRIPAIKHQAGLSDGQLGVALLCATGGMVVAMQALGWLVARFGSGPVTRAGGVLNCALLPGVALAWNLPSLVVALLVLGATFGLLDPAMNAHGVLVERGYGRRVFSSFHALWSGGGLLGSLAGGLAAHAGWSPALHLSVVALAGVAATIAATAWLLPPSGDERLAPAERMGRPSPRRSLWSRKVVLLGLIGLCSFVGEGAAGDWSGVYLRDHLHTSPGFAAAGFGAFSLAMAAGRFAGDALATRFGPVALLRASALVAAGGLGGGLAAGSPLATVAGFALLGVGLAFTIPTAFNAAGRLGHGAAGAVIARVASFSYAGGLLGPPLIGGAAELVGLRLALLVPVALALVIACCAPVAAAAPPTAAPEPGAPANSPTSSR